MKALDALLDIAGKQLNTPDNLTKEIFHKLKLPLKQQLTDLRSQIVRLACQVVTKFAVVAGHRSRDFLSFVMPQLISMAAGANKVMAGFALDCAREVCSVVQVHKAIAPLCELCTTSRNKAVVECAIECILVALNKWESFRRNDVDSVEVAFEHCLKAASSKARATARQCYWAFHKSYPDRALKILKRTDTRTTKLIIEEEPQEAEEEKEEEDDEEEEERSNTRSTRNSSTRSSSTAVRRSGRNKTTTKNHAKQTTEKRTQGERENDEHSGNGGNGRRQSVEHMSATMIQAMMRGTKTRVGTPLKTDPQASHSAHSSTTPNASPNNRNQPTPPSALSSPSSPNHRKQHRPSALPKQEKNKPPSSPRASSRSPRSPRSPAHSNKSTASPRSSLDETYVVGDRVLVTEQLLPAVVKFVGTTSFSHGLWIGCELTNATDEGKNSGKVKGVQYFKCVPNKGLFVRVGNLTKNDSVALDDEPEKEEQEEREDRDETTTEESPPAPNTTSAVPMRVPTEDTNEQTHNRVPSSGGNSSSSTVAEQLLNAHRTHVDEVLECLRNEMITLAEFEAAKSSSTHHVAAYASQIAESMHVREQMLEAMYQRLGTLCATLAKE